MRDELCGVRSACENYPGNPGRVPFRLLLETTGIDSLHTSENSACRDTNIATRLRVYFFPKAESTITSIIPAVAGFVLIVAVKVEPQRLPLLPCFHQQLIPATRALIALPKNGAVDPTPLFHLPFVRN